VRACPVHPKGYFIAGPLTLVSFTCSGDFQYTLAARQEADASLTSEG